MDKSRLFQIAPLPGFTPRISDLVSILNYARETTLDSVRGLTPPQLDHLHDPESNSIGALLLHVGAVEHNYQVNTLRDGVYTREEETAWGAALKLGARGRAEIRCHGLAWYLERLDAVREKTLAGLREKSDEWLYEEKPFWSGQKANHYFMWFHVAEDEINHRGQMRWLRKRLPSG